MKYLLICQSCGNRQFVDGTVTPPFAEVGTALPPSRADGKDKTAKQLPRKFKCPKCGYVFKIVKLEVELPADEKKEVDILDNEMPPLR